ncbi:hypothetical protein L7F22_011954 [Adiantum nelumboides]|nr:hypothetical protein [Adiantum nelumboides]
MVRLLQAPLACALFFALLYLQAASATLAEGSDKTQSLTTLCNATTNLALCISTLSSFRPSTQPSAPLQNLTAFVVSAAIRQLNRSHAIGHGLAQGSHKSVSDKGILQDCLELMDDSRDELLRSVQRLSHLDAKAPLDTLGGQVMDVRVWLSSSLSDLSTCWDELADAKAAQLRASFHGAGQEQVEPLLSIALTLAERLEQPGGAATFYTLPRRSNHHGGSRNRHRHHYHRHHRHNSHHRHHHKRQHKHKHHHHRRHRHHHQKDNHRSHHRQHAPPCTR